MLKLILFLKNYILLSWIIMHIYNGIKEYATTNNTTHLQSNFILQLLYLLYENGKRMRFCFIHLIYKWHFKPITTWSISLLHLRKCEDVNGVIVRNSKKNKQYNWSTKQYNWSTKQYNWSTKHYLRLHNMIPTVNRGYPGAPKRLAVLLCKWHPSCCC